VGAVRAMANLAVCNIGLISILRVLSMDIIWWTYFPSVLARQWDMMPGIGARLW